MKGYKVTANSEFEKTIQKTLSSLVRQEVPSCKQIVRNFEFFSTRMEIGEFFALVAKMSKESKFGSSVFCQRNHVFENNNGLANHIKTLTATQLRISILVASDGKMTIIDGNHRVDRWMKEGLPCEIPSFVQVDFYRIQEEEEAIDIYNQIDSPKAAKSAADNFVSGVRFAAAKRNLTLEKAFKSYAMNTGKRMVGVVKYFGSNSRGVKGCVSVVDKYWDAFCYLDKILGVRQNQHIQTGFMIGVLRLKQSIASDNSLAEAAMSSYVQCLYGYIQDGYGTGLNNKLTSIIIDTADAANSEKSEHAEGKATAYSDVIFNNFSKYLKVYSEYISSN